jgi:hypothetical protein
MWGATPCIKDWQRPKVRPTRGLSRARQPSDTFADKLGLWISGRRKHQHASAPVLVFHRKVGRGCRIRLCFYIAVTVLLRFWARDAQLRSVLCRPRNFERTQTNAWTGRARLAATESARFSYRWQKGFRPLHWPAAARGQRSRLWTALIAAPNDTGGNRVHTARRYRWVGGERKIKAVAF